MFASDPIETSIVKKYKKNIWHRFIKAGREYKLINDGDRILCVLRGDAQSLLFAKCFERLKKYSETQFELAFVSPDSLEDSYGLGVTLTADPGAFARAQGFNKLALPDCFDDCIEYILTSQLYEGRLQALTPSQDTGGLTIVRAGLLVRREDIAAFARYNSLSLPITAAKADERTLRVRGIIAELAKTNKNLEINILRSCEEVNLETVISYTEGGVRKSILDTF